MQRLLTPAFLVSPLVALLLVPALFYGASSDRAINSANRAMMTSLSPRDDRMAISSDFVCPTSDVKPSSLELRAAKVDGSNNQIALTSIGFNRAMITMHGERARSGLKRGNDVTDSITAHLRQQDGSWCLHDLDVSPIKP
jgi:hypothetical protein